MAQGMGGCFQLSVIALLGLSTGFIAGFFGIADAIDYDPIPYSPPPPPSPPSPPAPPRLPPPPSAPSPIQPLVTLEGSSVLCNDTTLDAVVPSTPDESQGPSVWAVCQAFPDEFGFTSEAAASHRLGDGAASAVATSSLNGTELGFCVFCTRDRSTTFYMGEPSTGLSPHQFCEGVAREGCMCICNL